MEYHIPQEKLRNTWYLKGIRITDFCSIIYILQLKISKPSGFTYTEKWKSITRCIGVCVAMCFQLKSHKMQQWRTERQRILLNALSATCCLLNSILILNSFEHSEKNFKILLSGKNASGRCSYLFMEQEESQITPLVYKGKHQLLVNIIQHSFSFVWTTSGKEIFCFFQLHWQYHLIWQKCIAM